MGDLASQECVPCKGGIPPLRPDQIQPLIQQLEGWSVVNDHHIKKSYDFPDFVKALDFVNAIAEIAEAQGHHPDLYLSWGKVGVEIWTHKIDGLTESDFVLGAKIDKIKRS